MSKYDSDYLDEACKNMLGHTNWDYMEAVDDDIAYIVRFYKKDEDGNKPSMEWLFDNNIEFRDKARAEYQDYFKNHLDPESGDDWHSFFFRNEYFDMNFYVEDITNQRHDAIYSTKLNKNGDLETNGIDFFKVPEHWRNIND